VTPSQAAAPSRGHAPARAPARNALRFVLAAGVGAIVVLAGGGLAWRSGLLSHGSAPTTAAATTAPAAPVTPAEPAAATAQAEATRVLSPTAPQEIPVMPAAGATPARSGAELDAALAAAARAAAVPADSVRAAGPAPVARPQPLTASLTAPMAAITPTAAAHGKPNVAEAIANAQAKADRFLSAGNASAPAAAEGKQAP
jgi:DNA polymerase-3 subunit gamma/tau